MKNNRALLLVMGLIWLAGCATFETNAYRSIGSISVSVDTAMNIWGDYVRAGKASTAQEGVVRDAYTKYQQAIKTVHLAVTAFHANRDAGTLNQSLALISAASVDLSGLIYQFSKPQNGP